MIDVHIPANLFYPELPGGANQYFRYGPFLRDRGVQLRVHTVRKPHHEEAELEIRGIRIKRYEVPPDSSLLGELEFLTERAIEAIKRNSNSACIHPLGTTEASIGSVKRLWRARLLGIPSCFHFMTVEGPNGRGIFGRLKELAMYQAVFSPYQKHLMCSQIMGRVFAATTGLSMRKTEVIPNGIDLSVFSPVDSLQKRTLREKLEWPTDDPVVLFVGSVVPRKGVDTLIETWSRVLKCHPSAKLVIVGSIEPRATIRDPATITENESYVDGIRHQVEALPVPQSVIFAGETDRVEDFYRASDLFAFASRREGLPSVVLEAMACGIPCVLAPFIGLPADGEEYGVHGEHFIKTTFDPSQMADDIVRLIESEETRRNIGTNASEWIRDTQEMGKATDRLASVYRDLALSD